MPLHAPKQAVRYALMRASLYLARSTKMEHCYVMNCHHKHLAARMEG